MVNKTNNTNSFFILFIRMNKNYVWEIRKKNRKIKTNLLFLLSKKVCFDQYELDYLGRIKFLHVEMPH